MENSNKQQVARNLFLHTDKTRAEIADIIDVNSKTLYLWIRNGRWAEVKAAARQSPTEVLQSFYDHIHAINRSIRQRHDQCPTFQEVEMLRKLVASTRHVQKLNIGTYIETYQELTTYIAARDNALGIRVVKFADDYIRGKHSTNSMQNLDKVNEVMQNLDKMEKEEQAESEQDPNPQDQMPTEEKDEQTNEETEPHTSDITPQDFFFPDDCTIWSEEQTTKTLTDLQKQIARNPRTTPPIATTPVPQNCSEPVILSLSRGEPQQAASRVRHT